MSITVLLETPRFNVKRKAFALTVILALHVVPVDETVVSVLSRAFAIGASLRTRFQFALQS